MPPAMGFERNQQLQWLSFCCRRDSQHSCKTICSACKMCYLLSAHMTMRGRAFMRFRLHAPAWHKLQHPLLLLLQLNITNLPLSACSCHSAAITYNIVSYSGFLNPPSPSPNPTPPPAVLFTCAQYSHTCISGTLRPNALVPSGPQYNSKIARDPICCVSGAAM
jgi:hypothetical protein